MDVVSHLLIGRIVQRSSRARDLRSRLLIILAAAAPDLPVAFVYLLLGREHQRPFWIPLNTDWFGVRELHPGWAAAWEIPHSLFFLMLVVVPLVLWLRWPKAVMAAYASHLLVDIPTHTREWAVKPLYPFAWTVEGVTDAWAWPIYLMAVAWIGLLGVDLLMARRRQRRNEADRETVTVERRI